MQDFLFRLLIVIGVIWLIDKVLSIFTINARARTIIDGIVIIIGVIWLLFGYTVIAVK